MDNHIQVKLISLEDIYRTKCFDLKQIIQIIEDALLAYSNNEILLPDKISQIFNEESSNSYQLHAFHFIKRRRMWS